MWLKKFIAVTIFLMLCACTQSIKGISEKQLGKVIDLKTNDVLTPQQWVKRIAGVEHLLVGEKHDNLLHHQAQYWLLEQLQKQRPQGSLILEMLSVDQQPMVDLVKTEFAKNSQNLTARLNWKKSWNWDFYGDLVKHPFEYQYQLIASNLTQGEVQQILKGAEPLKGFASTSKDIKEKIAQLILSSHQCDNCSASEPYIQRMVEVQQFRDRRMAEKLLASPMPNILIAGNHHIQKKYGVPTHLKDLSPTTKFTTILMTNNHNGYSNSDSDYLWILTE